MATRTSTRSTKAVKFVDSADEDEEEFNNAETPRIKEEPKKTKTRGRPPRRTRTNDDEEWDARNEQSAEEEDDDDDVESDEGEDVTKKFKTNTVNRTIDSVYDFG
jgi:hypothetical protein